MTLRACALALLIGLAACNAKAPQAQTAFAGLVADIGDELAADDPERAFQTLADADAPQRLRERGRVAEERRRTAAIRYVTLLRATDASQLPPQERLQHRALVAHFEPIGEAAAFSYGRLDPVSGFSPYALNPFDSAFVTLPGFFQRLPPTKQLIDAHRYVERLAEVGDAIDAESQLAQSDAAAGVTPPRFIIEATLAALDQRLAQPPAESPYVVDLRTRLTTLVGPLDTAEGEPSRDVARAQALLARAETLVADEIIPAHRRAAETLRAMWATAGDAPGATGLPDGESYYRASLHQAGAATAPEALHERGLQSVRSLTAELEGALRVVGRAEGTVGERLAQMTADPAFQYVDTDEGRAVRANDRKARIAWVMDRGVGWFGALPRGAPPLDEPPAALANKIDLPAYDFRAIAPGEAFRVAVERQRVKAPAVFRMVADPAFEDGWGLYAAQLMDELGGFENDRTGRIGYLRMRLRGVAAIVADTGMHDKDWSLDQAIAYVQATTGDPLPLVETEIARAVVFPGRACAAELGRAAIEAQRTRAQRALGARFDLKRFHDTLLLSGGAPLPVLDDIVTAYINGTRSAP